MMRNGIKLYAEADQAERTFGVLISYCRPPNLEAVGQAERAMIVVIAAVRRTLLDSIEKEHPQGVPNSEERQRYNLTRAAVKDAAKGALERMREELRRNVWKG